MCPGRPRAALRLKSTAHVLGRHLEDGLDPRSDHCRYGPDAGVLFYSHVSDQYAPFHIQVINATVRDATYVLDGLLYHEADLGIEEHYTGTAGFTDHVFGLMHVLGFRFAPRIRDRADRRLYLSGTSKRFPTLTPLIGGIVNLEHIRMHWDEVLRLASSIRQGTVTASLMLRKLGGYPRQNGLAIALTGDYTWKGHRAVERGHFRALRPFASASRMIFSVS